MTSIELRSAGKIYSLRCRFRRRAGQGGFPSVRHAKSFEDACEIVGAPAMAQYERSRDGPWVLMYLQFTSRLPEQSLEAIVRTAPRGGPPSKTATTEAWRSRKPPNEPPAVEHPGASVSSLPRRSRRCVAWRLAPVWAWSVATQVAQATYVPAIFDGTASGTPLEWRERSVDGQLHGQCHPPQADIMRI